MANPKYGVAYTFDIELSSQGTAATFQSSPTLAAGDVKITKNGGALADLATLPVVTPAAGTTVKVDLSATEMQAERIAVLFVDAAGAEWHPVTARLHTTTLTIEDILTAAQVNTEVVDALNVDTYAEPGQGAPAATTTLAAKVNYLYKFLRNRITQSATTLSVFADNGTTVDQKATVSDSGTVYDRGEIASGP